jgi:hypothetical protein
VKSELIRYSGIVLAAGFLFTSSAHAFNMGKMMNPTKWFKGNKSDDYYDDRYGPGYPPPPGYGYGGPGYGGPGYGYGGPGYGGPGYGYGGPGYGYGGPGYGAAPGYGAPAQQAPQMGSGADTGEISRLKERIRQLEEANREIPPPSSSYSGQQGYRGTAPAYGAQPGYQQAPAYGGQGGYPGKAPGYGGQSGQGGGQPGYQQAPAPSSYGNPNPQFRPLNTN